MTRIDLTSDLFYPPVPRLGRLPRSAVRRLIQEADRAGEEENTVPEAEFRVIYRTKSGLVTEVGPWIRPGGPASGKQVRS